ncbi:S9 family peptidase [Allobranchiibius sp. CTAmp26]|uniref:S9 family peptidase n=1 Tax=Allobranchiibius sp. CTAmp26 TaxID=2815214 RepID=UPI001AA16E3D|nr:S9 family peptidase [Allobranchiibius sp. CTAmp26]MBO1755270.1 S9 family peptidase [Allobranchiibius sp. CTAmp26]
MALHEVAAPVARRTATVREHHGDRFEDQWEWLRDKESREVIAHLEAENAYTQARTAHLQPLVGIIFEEIKGHVVETDVDVPVRKGEWWYYSRTAQGAQYAVHCRAPYVGGAPRPVPAPGEPVDGEVVLLDENHEAGAHEFFELGGLEISPDGRLLALLVDVSGDERYDLQVRDLATGMVLDQSVQDAHYGLAWSLDAGTVFYIRHDDAWRPHQIWRHVVGGDPAQDVLVREEADPEFGIGFEVSRDDRWMIVEAASRTSSEVLLGDLSRPDADLVMVEPRAAGVEYSVEVDGDRIFIAHNLVRPDFDLAQAPVATPGREHWTTVLALQDGERLEGVDAFAGFVAVSLRSGGLPTVRVLPKVGTGLGEAVHVPTESPLAVVRLGANAEYDESTLRLSMGSYLLPPSVLQFDPVSGDVQLLKQQEVPGYRSADYLEERLWARGDDGTQVPISLIRRHDVVADGSNPGLVYGYGSYEIPSDPRFSASRLSLLDRGVVFAVAHVRGGGELGRRWWDEGKMLAKRNTFTDFVACSRALVDAGWVSPDRLAAEGGSAGGLLMGAVVNLAPELYRAVHAAVPFVDALTTMLDPLLPLTVGEWQEWGDPLHDPAIYAYMKSYTPYENVAPTAYPAILATTSLNDTRVFYVEPAKWVQQLRATVTSDPDDRPVLLKCEMVAGHGGVSGRYDAWRDIAFELAFLLDQLGATDLH